ncbi:MAG: D-alanine--D-alanine ligase [Candidatus Omnitrophota bacterium]|jgi:D-alanine-D-alanine ligase
MAVNDMKKDFNPGKIGVLLGGPSSEKEISLKSGRAVCSGLSFLGLEALPVEVATDNVPAAEQLLRDSGIDCAFIALHGYFGEDGQIQEILERIGLPYTGSGPAASRLCMDKAASREVFLRNGFNVARGVVFNRRDGFDPAALEELAFPLVIKPACNGSSIGVSFADDRRQAEEAARAAFLLDDKVIAEEFVGGKELTVGILAGRALPVIGIVPQKRFFDYEAKYNKGITEYEIPAVIDRVSAEVAQAAALKAHNALGCNGYSRVDIILSDRGPVILEINSIPGMTETSLLPKAAAIEGMDFPHLCLRLLELAYEKEQRG